MSVERAELGVDGNCGFALLGENTQEGEAEFIKIDYEAKDGLGRDVMGSQAERIAAQEALEKLQIR